MRGTRDQLIAVIAAGLLLGSACRAGAPTVEAPGDARAESEAAIKAADLAASAAANTRDVDKLASFYTEDTAFMPPNGPLMTGRESAKKFFAEMMQPADFSIAWQPTKVEAARSGEIGYSIGTYHVMFTGPDGKMIMDDGKYSTVWKKQADGSWKLAVDMFNSNTPLPLPPAAGPKK
jgi:uncharacterized protein (TIGR02246 family)